MTTLREGLAELVVEAHTTIMTSHELRTWRSGHGMTQAEAAIWVGVSRRTWIRYEMDERTIPRWLRIIVVSVPASGALRRQVADSVGSFEGGDGDTVGSLEG